MLPEAVTFLDLFKAEQPGSQPSPWSVRPETSPPSELYDNEPAAAFAPPQHCHIMSQPSHSSRLPKGAARAAAPHTGPTVTRRFVASVVREDTLPETTVDCPPAILAFWRGVVAVQPGYEPEKESLVVILVSTRLRPFAWHLVSLGTVEETIAHPREILRPAVIGAAHGIVLAHNHPGGDPSPSQADCSLTKQVGEACKLMRIRFVDHVIVTDANRAIPGIEPQFSFRQAGLV